MFYTDIKDMDMTLRFGDIIQGFPICFPVIDEPSLEQTYHIQVPSFTHSVVLSPCCSISDKLLSIAPLIQLNPKIFANQFLANDPKLINIKIPAEKSVPPIAWEKMTPEERANRLSKGDGYVFVDWFIFDENQLFKEYVINRKEGKISSRYYMVDFRMAVRINCDKIANPSYTPGNYKILQLTVETRDMLRKKISSFYQRTPAEDEAVLQS